MAATNLHPVASSVEGFSVLAKRSTCLRGWAERSFGVRRGRRRLRERGGTTCSRVDAAASGVLPGLRGSDLPLPCLLLSARLLCGGRPPSARRCRQPPDVRPSPDPDSRAFCRRPPIEVLSNSSLLTAPATTTFGAPPSSSSSGARGDPRHALACRRGSTRRGNRDRDHAERQSAAPRGVARVRSRQRSSLVVIIRRTHEVVGLRRALAPRASGERSRCRARCGARATVY